MKRLSLLLLAICCLALSASVAKADEDRIVIRVISGDTIVVDGGEIVRMIGVLTPTGDEPYAKEAYEFTRGQLLGKEVKLIKDNQNGGSAHRDSFGRTLAYVYRLSDSSFINRILLLKGYAFVTTQNINKFLAQFQTDQLEARKSHRGVWEKTDKTPEEQAKAEYRTYQEPLFETKPEYKDPDILVEIQWAKKADPRLRIGRTPEEAKFLQRIYEDKATGSGEAPTLVLIRKNFAEALTDKFKKDMIGLQVFASGSKNEVLSFVGEGMDEETAKKFYELPDNRQLFTKLEFEKVIFADEDEAKFKITYEIEQ